MIKHLLILREQIAPFEAEFMVAEKDLDFGHMRDQLRRIMAGESSLFALGSSNALMQLMGNGVRVMESRVRVSYSSLLSLGGLGNGRGTPILSLCSHNLLVCKCFTADAQGIRPWDSDVHCL